MFVVLYPNNELISRQAPETSRQRRSSSKVLSPLVNELKLADKYFVPPEACRYPSCEWPRVGYGGLPKARPFSLYARRMLSRSGGCFCPSDEKRTVFLTGTLPGSTEAAMEALSKWSSWFVHRLLEAIPRCAGHRASDLLWMWVWEYQGRGALHWHGVVECPDAESAQGLLDGFRSVWVAAIAALSEKSGVDCCERRRGGSWRSQPDKWRIDSQIAAASPSQYLAKYLSKDAGKASVAGFFPPCRWYGISRRLLQELRSKTVIVKTSSYFGGEDYFLSQKDLRVIEMLWRVSECSKVFKQKFSDRVTFVFHLGSNVGSRVRRFLGRIKPMESKGSQGNDKREYICRVGKNAVRYPSVERMMASPNLLLRLYADLGSWYQLHLNNYVANIYVDKKEMGYIDQYAARLLYMTGHFVGGNAPQRSEVGLPSDVPEKLESDGGTQVELNYPGLPF
jgi:hypothetical protein